MKKSFIIFFFALTALFSPKANAQADGFLGEVKMFAGSYAPKGWMDCNGQLLPLAQNTALFSLLGTTYGGDGQTTFALPDLRNTIPVGIGTGPSGLGTITAGQRKNLVIPDMKDHKPIGAINELGMRYIICVDGVFPPRN